MAKKLYDSGIQYFQVLEDMAAEARFTDLTMVELETLGVPDTYSVWDEDLESYLDRVYS